MRVSCHAAHEGRTKADRLRTRVSQGMQRASRPPPQRQPGLLERNLLRAGDGEDEAASATLAMLVAKGAALHLGEPAGDREAEPRTADAIGDDRPAAEWL